MHDDVRFVCFLLPFMPTYKVVRVDAIVWTVELLATYIADGQRIQSHGQDDGPLCHEITHCRSISLAHDYRGTSSLEGIQLQGKNPN